MTCHGKHWFFPSSRRGSLLACRLNVSYRQELGFAATFGNCRGRARGPASAATTCYAPEAREYEGLRPQIRKRR
jgi:hypothetical protein